MIKLRSLVIDDMDAIKRWPPYPPEFGDLDYALRANGWLTEYWNKPDTWGNPNIRTKSANLPLFNITTTCYYMLFILGNQ
ncbi:MAG: hypothetical protein KKD63_05400 [Proteobacteria bacterium]|nr:hypothetical protein [Desulfobulbaceae bacterium]MBU4152295.1 hypothetical protein [Pseudomonadota bacterium]